jgi:hypothetical protein
MGYCSFPLEIRDAKIYQPPDTSIYVLCHLCASSPSRASLSSIQLKSSRKKHCQGTRLCLEIRDGKRKIEAMVRSLGRNTSRQRRTQPHISQACARVLPVELPSPRSNSKVRGRNTVRVLARWILSRENRRGIPIETRNARKKFA